MIDLFVVFVTWASHIVDALAVVAMGVGLAYAVVSFVRASLLASGQDQVSQLQLIRRQFGAYLSFGLELMILSDLLVSIVSHTLEDLYHLGALVVIRTLIGYFLNKEIQEIGESRESI